MRWCQVKPHDDGPRKAHPIGMLMAGQGPGRVSLGKMLRRKKGVESGE